MKIVIEIDPTWLWHHHESLGMDMEASEIRFAQRAINRINWVYAHLMVGPLDENNIVLNVELPSRVLAPIKEPIISIEGASGDNLASIRSHVREILRYIRASTDWLIKREVSADPLLGGM